MRNLVAVFLMIFASGCATSGDVPVTIAPVLPDIPPELAKECPDPGVDEDSFVALAENRVYAACSRRKHRDAVLFYRNSRKQLTGPVKR